MLAILLDKWVSPSTTAVLGHVKIRYQHTKCWCAGIPEDALLDELDALLPASATRLLSILEHEGLLSVRSAAQPASRIPRILMRPHQSAEPLGKVSVFILHLACLQQA